jgi:hypothetical protein
VVGVTPAGYAAKGLEITLIEPFDGGPGVALTPALFNQNCTTGRSRDARDWTAAGVGAAFAPAGLENATSGSIPWALKNDRTITSDRT